MTTHPKNKAPIDASHGSMTQISHPRPRIQSRIAGEPHQFSTINPSNSGSWRLIVVDSMPPLPETQRDSSSNPQKQMTTGHDRRS
ncbi:hypothetical protein ACLOJK_008713 [Asimina triloba]